jgi:PPOX class probable F420-dependent enzyme
MSAVPDPVLGWLAAHQQAVLVTLRADGSPQTSNVMYHLADGVLRVSVTEDRAKTRNLRHRPRGVLHVLGDTFWEYASVLVDAELGPVSTTPGDEAGRELLDLYEAITGSPHPDPAEFYAAMVGEHRLVLRLTPVSAVAPSLSG